MRDIQLIPWGSECAASENTIKFLILSYMLFPNEEEKRKVFLALLGSQAREYWRTAQPEQVAQWVADRAETEISSPLPPERIEAARDRLKEEVTVDFQDFFGGADVIGLLPPKAKLLQETRGGYQNWLRVGIMFRLLIDFHHYYDHRTACNIRTFRHPSPKVILLAKSETLTIQGQDALVNSVCQSASPCENDFASRIKSDDDPTSFTSVGSSADSPEPPLRLSPVTGHNAEMFEG